MNQVASREWNLVGEFLSSLEVLVLGIIVSSLCWCVQWCPLFGAAIRSETVRWRVGKEKSPRFLQIHEGSARALSIPVLPHQASLFLSRQSPILLGRYRWTGEWLLCRIFWRDVPGTYTVVWQDGFLQVGTPSQDLRSLSPPLVNRVVRQLVKERDAESQEVQGTTQIKGSVDPMTINGLSVWEAAKVGDMATTLAIVDQGGATPNDVELLDSQIARADTVLQGRTPLYWACFGGHVELVRELLLRGGVDHDGAAYIAVTARQGADDNQDILFDPDTGVFSDYVDYDPVVSRRKGEGEDDAFLIRAMLVAVKSAVPTNAKSLRHRLPKQLYHESSKECVVCWVNPANAAIVPCGHVACCTSCLTKVRKSRDGCPLCRAAIVAIIPDSSVSEAGKL